MRHKKLENELPLAPRQRQLAVAWEVSLNKLDSRRWKQVSLEAAVLG
jgi:hypothetical protein